MPEKKIKNYRLNVLNGKDQQKNEKNDDGDQFSAHLLGPFFSSIGDKFNHLLQAISPHFPCY